MQLSIFDGGSDPPSEVPHQHQQHMGTGWKCQSRPGGSEILAVEPFNKGSR